MHLTKPVVSPTYSILLPKVFDRAKKSRPVKLNQLDNALKELALLAQELDLGSADNNKKNYDDDGDDDGDDDKTVILAMTVMLAMMAMLAMMETMRCLRKNWLG